MEKVFVRHMLIPSSDLVTVTVGGGNGQFVFDVDTVTLEGKLAFTAVRGNIVFDVDTLTPGGKLAFVSVRRRFRARESAGDIASKRYHNEEKMQRAYSEVSNSLNGMDAMKLKTLRGDGLNVVVTAKGRVGSQEILKQTTRPERAYSLNTLILLLD